MHVSKYLFLPLVLCPTAYALSIQEQAAPVEAGTEADEVDPAMVKMGDFIEKLKVDKTDARWKTRLPKPPLLEFDPERKYYWVLDTNQGVIRVRLLPEVAPMHVSSTIFLTEIGFYDDLTFHRVIQGFMAQGGCPLGSGTGSPGYQYAGEFSPTVKHDRPGLLSMANAGPGTDGSQFFLTFVPTPHLNGKHTIFGEVVDGMDVVRELEKRGSGSGKTTEPLLLEKSRIESVLPGPLPSAAPDATKALAQMTKFIAAQGIDKTKAAWRTSLPKPPELQFSKEQSYFWNLRTNKGDIKVKLMTETAPMHASSTIYLTLSGFYDDLTFHRVIPGFMAQGGCPLGSGTGSPGYKYAGEFSDAVKHDRPGLLSMANSGPNTDGSQFFLTFVPTPHLDGKHTIFGEVVEGMDTLAALEAVGTRSGRPTQPLQLQKATISLE